MKRGVQPISHPATDLSCHELIDDRAFVEGTLLTFLLQAQQGAFHPFQLAKLFTHLGDVIGQQLVHRLAWRLRLTGDCREPPNLMLRQSERAAAQSELQPLAVTVIVLAIPVPGSLGCRQQTDFFVVPNGFDRTAASSGQFANLHGLTL
jgi:hypothetical protein